MWMLSLYETSIITALESKTNDSGLDTIYVGTLNPVSLYFLTPVESPVVKSIHLHDGHFRITNRNMGKVRLALLPGDRVALHEEESNTLMFISPESGIVHGISLMSAFEAASDRIYKAFSSDETDSTTFKMSKELAHAGQLIMWEHNGGRIQLLDTINNVVHSLAVPFKLHNLIPINEHEWLLTDKDGAQFLLRKDEEKIPNVIYPITENLDLSQATKDILQISGNIDDSILSKALQQNISAPSRILATNKNLAQIIVGFPELDSSENEIWAWERTKGLPPTLPYPSAAPSSTTVIIPEAGQVVRVLDNLPPGVVDNEVNRNIAMSFLEIVDLTTQSVSYISIPRTVHPSPYWNYIAGRYAVPMLISKKGKDGLVTIDAAGGLRLWQTGIIGIENALKDWRNMIGMDDAPLRLEIERESGLDVSSPKHGKVDENNDPHVGGNQWAGGTGGRDTAGLGGKGGPYRLDAGHDVYQVSQAEKDAVPEEVRRAAREMGKKAFQQRLKEIKMSEFDAQMYDRLESKVKKQITALRSILTSLQARSKERQWLRHRTEGELDETKLIEGIAGERNIYRLRREEEPEIGAPQTKPKRLRLLVDLSGSMYRFNGHDGRLERELEVTLMVMEAFEGFEAKFKYDIYGHSGEDMAVPLVTVNDVPKNDKERLEIIRTMQAHAQFCLSGDHTIHAAKHAVNAIAKEEADEHFVIMLSDANLERYGIRPKVLADVFASQPDVRSYAIFIGSLGNQADRLTKALPAGQSFTCLDLQKLPQILQQIFTSSILS